VTAVAYVHAPWCADPKDDPVFEGACVGSIREVPLSPMSGPLDPNASADGEVWVNACRPAGASEDQVHVGHGVRVGFELTANEARQLRDALDAVLAEIGTA
jgi:hypothetical protein